MPQDISAGVFELFFYISIKSLLKKFKAIFDNLINMLVKPQLKQQDNRETERGLRFKNTGTVDVGEEGFLAIADSWETCQIASSE